MASRSGWPACGASAGATFTVLVLLSLVTGCAAVSLVPPSEPIMHRARSLSPAPGTANVYVIRAPASIATQPLWTIDLDFRGFGTLPARSYLYGWIAPGAHVLAVLQDDQVQDRLRFVAREGQNYFFRVKAGLLNLHLERVDDQTGRALVAAFSLTGDNRFEEETPPPPSRAARAE